jgi:hypothetical protein
MPVPERPRRNTDDHVKTSYSEDDLESISETSSEEAVNEPDESGDP